MSAEAVGAVFKYSSHKGAALLVQLAIADSVNEMGDYEMWARQSWIAEKVNIGRQACNEAIKTLVGNGDLEILEDNSKAGKSNRYRFVLPRPATTGGVSSEATPGVVVGDRGGVAIDDTEPKSTNPTEPPVGVADDASPPGSKIIGDNYPKAFTDCWNAYRSSRRGGKKAAYNAWRATVEREIREATPRGEILTLLLRATKEYMAEVRDKPDEYVKLAQTFWGPGQHYRVKYNLNISKASGTRNPDGMPDEWMRGGTL